jgi:hypothetical protein
MLKSRGQTNSNFYHGIIICDIVHLNPPNPNQCCLVLVPWPILISVLKTQIDGSWEGEWRTITRSGLMIFEGGKNHHKKWFDDF